MLYRVYTDAATKLKEGYSSVAFLVLKGNTYLKKHNERKEVSSTSSAESLAVGLALKYVVEELETTEEDEIIVFCDSLYTVKFARKCLKSFKHENKGDNYCVEPTNAFWLTDIYHNIPKIKGKLKFSKIKAHPKGKNPHCYVDRLAKSGLVNY